MDSTEIAQLLATQLAQDTGVARYELTPSASSFLGSFLPELGFPVRSSLDGIPPRCPWGWEATAGPFGYRLAIVRITIDGGTAGVVVHFSCDNPPGYVHDRFGKRVEFTFRRTSAGWEFRGRALLWIT